MCHCCNTVQHGKEGLCTMGLDLDLIFNLLLEASQCTPCLYFCHVCGEITVTFELV